MNEVATTENNKALMAGNMDWSREQIDLIKKTVAKGTSDDELKLFLYTCKKTGLDPLIRQIYAVKRGGNSNQMSIQTGIDGYRLIAERTGNYAPGREPSYVEKDNKIISATAYVKKRVGGEWHEVAATAFFDEYAQKFNGKLGAMWERMGHVMISKCAEALALRRAFPAEMCGIYTNDEMSQAEVVEVVPAHQKPQRLSATAEPTQAELEAKALEAKDRYSKEQEKPSPEATEGPTNGNSEPVLIVKGKVLAHYPPKGKGPHSFKVGSFTDYLKTFDEMLAETLMEHKVQGDEIEVSYEVVSKGGYENSMITGIAAQGDK